MSIPNRESLAAEQMRQTMAPTQNNFIGVGWGLALGAAMGGYLGYQAGKSEEFRARMAEYQKHYTQQMADYQQEWGARMSTWYNRQSTTLAKRYQDWSEKNSGTVDA